MVARRTGKGLVGLLTLWLTAGCASAGPSVAPVERFEEWIRFYGEFELFPSQLEMQRDKNNTCVSGTLPLQEELSAMHRFQLAHVAVYGRKVPWPLLPPGITGLENGGSRVTNLCHGKYVIFASKIQELGA